MNRSDVCYLISEDYLQNEYGVMQSVEQRTKVYCSVTSVSATEWFEGGRSGLNPSYRMTVFTYDYHGEEIIEYNGVRYSIYRTYMKDDEIELYVQKRTGNGKE